MDLILGIENLRLDLAEIGKVKIGGRAEKRTSKSGGTYRRPEKYDHFVIVKNEKNEAGDYIRDTKLMQKLAEKYYNDPNAKLKHINIIFMFDNPALNFQYYLARFTASGLQCYGNGVKARTRTEAIIDEETGELKEEQGWKEIPCNPDKCPFFKKEECKAHGTLKFLIKETETLGGIYTFRTTSWNSIGAIASSLAFFWKASGGYLAMIPFQLVFREKTVITKKGQKVKIPYVNVEFKGTFEDFYEQLEGIYKIRSLVGAEVNKLESLAAKEIKKALPESLTKEEQEEVAEEFYPDTVEKELNQTEENKPGVAIDDLPF